MQTDFYTDVFQNGKKLGYVESKRIFFKPMRHVAGFSCSGCPSFFQIIAVSFNKDGEFVSEKICGSRKAAIKWIRAQAIWLNKPFAKFYR